MSSATDRDLPAAPELPRRRDRLRRRGPRRRIRPVAAIPTLLTLGNLVCGFAAIYYAMKEVGPTQVFGWSSLTVAGLLIFVGMFFDAVDGSVARLAKATSTLGGQLDSLADMVSFGVAPAFMMLRLVSHYYGVEGVEQILPPHTDLFYGRVIWAIAALYVCCTALRLARFHAETPSHDEEDHRNFKGLPSPGAAGLVASLIVLHQHLLFRHDALDETPFARISAYGLPLVTLGAAILMVSTVRYPHFANRVLRARRDFAGIVRLIVPVILGVFWLQVTIAAGFTLYALLGPARALWLLTRRRADAPPAGTA
jgi:CDP-diacylglycerol--serine O-phosphatidyltransferase